MQVQQQLKKTTWDPLERETEWKKNIADAKCPGGGRLECFVQFYKQWKVKKSEILKLIQVTDPSQLHTLS